MSALLVHSVELLLANSSNPVDTLGDMFVLLGDKKGLKGLEYLIMNPDECTLFAQSRGLKVHTIEAVAFSCCMELAYGNTITFH